VGSAGLRELFVEGEHLLHQGNHGTVAGDIDGIGI
jgi:hypothetical protein